MRLPNPISAFAALFVIALAAYPSASSSDFEVIARQRMSTALAMGLLLTKCMATALINQSGHSLKMFRVNAQLISAKMIYLQTIWNGSLE